jgi:hypothetical protein
MDIRELCVAPGREGAASAASGPASLPVIGSKGGASTRTAAGIGGGAKGPSRSAGFDDMNGILAKLLIHLTASMRFAGDLNVDLNEITTNLVPYPRLHFLMSSLRYVRQTRAALSLWAGLCSCLFNQKVHDSDNTFERDLAQDLDLTASIFHGKRPKLTLSLIPLPAAARWALSTPGGAPGRSTRRTSCGRCAPAPSPGATSSCAQIHGQVRAHILALPTGTCVNGSSP